jgi:putative tryptophan/tyrosine transport system substrate-binding protein
MRYFDRRRALLGTAALLATAPTRAQGPKKLVRIGGLSAAVPRESPLWAALERRLAELGYVDKKTLVFEFRNAAGRFEQLPTLARELAGTRPDVVIVTGPEQSIRAAKQAAGTIPVVMIAIDFDPVAAGLIRSLNRPGTNMTGLSAQQIDLVVKRFQMLREMLPKLNRLAVLSNETTGTQLAAVTRAAFDQNVALDAIELGDPPHNYGAVMETARRNGADALLVLSAGVFFRDRQQIVQQAIANALPAAYSQSEFADAGGLLAYGVDLPLLFRRAAEYADRIVKGAAPAELAAEQATKFDLVINAKTAKTLKVVVPQSLLLRAERVIY